MRFLELHSVEWGPIQGCSEVCIRLSDTLFDVHVDASRKGESSYWFTPNGLPPHALPTSEPFVLSGIVGRFVLIVSRDDPDPEFPDDCGVVVRVQLHAQMPAVAFRPNPELALTEGVSCEDAMLLANPDGAVLINWISEDENAWFFNYFSFGWGAKRVDKRDGSVTSSAHSMPIPGQLPRRPTSC